VKAEMAVGGAEKESSNSLDLRTWLVPGPCLTFSAVLYLDPVVFLRHPVRAQVPG
jgi:hypothetical protein